MTEMLVQNQEGYVEFLPCLPDEWKRRKFQRFMFAWRYWGGYRVERGNYPSSVIESDSQSNF